MNEGNFFAELKRRNVYATEMKELSSSHG